MRILAVASHKGGAGKTMVAAHLAVQAAAIGPGPVALVDVDRMTPLAGWDERRTGESPVVVASASERLAIDLDMLRERGFRMAVIDTPPALPPTLRQMIAPAELVLIPTRPGIHDRGGAIETAALCDGMGKPVLFVVNAAPTDGRVAYDCAVALASLGSVAPTVLHDRPEFAAGLNGGDMVMRDDPDGAGAIEIAALWLHVCDRLERSFRRTVFRVPGHGGAAAGRAPGGFGRRVTSGAPR